MTRSSVSALLVLAATALATSHASAATPPSPKDCLGCHGKRDVDRSAAERGRSASVFVDAADLAASPHDGLDCVSCHTTATAPHARKLPPVDCSGCHDQPAAALATGVHGAGAGADTRGAVTCASCHGSHRMPRAAALSAATCTTCHASEAQAYQDSVHGRSRQAGGTDAATCRSCHGPAHAVVAKSNPASPVYHLNLPRTCAQCHADAALAKRHNIQVGNVYQLYMDSIHGRAVTRSGLLVAANCSDCHGSHDIRAHADPASRVFRSNIPRTCGGCHAGIESTYRQSVHGSVPDKGGEPAAVCTDCHSAHQIQRVAGAPWQLDVIRECGTCHSEALKTYRDTFHGKVTQLGFARVAKCADCHGSHTIRPASDPSSKVSATNIVNTCRQCHRAATWSFAQFDPHADPEQRTRFPLLYYSSLFMTALLIGTFGFFGFHTILWFPRSLIERMRRRRRGRDGPS